MCSCKYFPLPGINIKDIQGNKVLRACLYFSPGCVRFFMNKKNIYGKKKPFSFGEERFRGSSALVTRDGTDVDGVCKHQRDAKTGKDIFICLLVLVQDVYYGGEIIYRVLFRNGKQIARQLSSTQTNNVMRSKNYNL